MDREHWQRVERVLDVALESDPARWPTLLDESCRGDAGLRRDVESPARPMQHRASLSDSTAGLRRRAGCGSAERRCDRSTDSSDGASPAGRSLGRSGRVDWPASTSASARTVSRRSAWRSRCFARTSAGASTGVGFGQIARRWRRSITQASRDSWMGHHRRRPAVPRRGIRRGRADRSLLRAPRTLGAAAFRALSRCRRGGAGRASERRDSSRSQAIEHRDALRRALSTAIPEAVSGFGPKLRMTR
jgi:hypothetical protein